MSKYYLLIILIFFYAGCSLVNPNSPMDTKEYMLSGINEQLSTIEESGSIYKISSNNDLNNNIKEESNIAISTKKDVINLNFPAMNHNITYTSGLLSNKVHFDNKKVKLSIESMPLNKFINLIFSKVLKVNFVLDKSIEKNTQPVSLNIKDEISKDKLFDIVLNILNEFHITVSIEKNIFYIKSSKKRFVSAQGVYIGDELPMSVSDNSIVYMMKPYYYNNKIEKYSDFIKTYFLSRDAKLKVDRGERLIKIKDKAKNIRKAIKFYDFIDKPSMYNKELKLVKMKYMDVDKFIKQMKPILAGYGINVTDSIRQPGVKFVPIKQINSFMLISDNNSWTKTVLLWKDKLDVPIETSITQRGFFVYKPLNRKANELVSIIQKFISSGGKNSLNDRNGTKNIKNKEPLLFSNNLQVVLDSERNNIIIHSTKEEYLELSKMLKELDTLPQQILIEVTIAEVTLRDSMQFGLEWFLKTRGKDYGLNFTALGAGSAGVAGILTTTSGDFGASFNALQTNKYVNILSNPKLLVLNNHSGTINIGNQVPIVSSQATASDLGATNEVPSVLQNIEYKNTGIQLTVKPTINSQGFLTLNINQNTSDAQANDTSDISSPLIFNRSISTSVLLKSGEMVVLGGLITENKSRDKTQLPILGSIPILGHLFSTSGDSIDKTELVIMVKPTILRNSEDSRVVTDALLNIINFK